MSAETPPIDLVVPPRIKSARDVPSATAVCSELSAFLAQLGGRRVELADEVVRLRRELAAEDSASQEVKQKLGKYQGWLKEGAGDAGEALLGKAAASHLATTVQQAEQVAQKLAGEQQSRKDLEAEIAQLRAHLDKLKGHVRDLKHAQDERRKQPLVDHLAGDDVDALLKKVQARERVRRARVQEVDEGGDPLQDMVDRMVREGEAKQQGHPREEPQPQEQPQPQAQAPSQPQPQAPPQPQPQAPPQPAAQQPKAAGQGAQPAAGGAAAAEAAMVPPQQQEGNEEGKEEECKEGEGVGGGQHQAVGGVEENQGAVSGDGSKAQQQQGGEVAAEVASARSEAKAKAEAKEGSDAGHQQPNEGSSRASSSGSASSSSSSASSSSASSSSASSSASSASSSSSEYSGEYSDHDQSSEGSNGSK